MSGDDGSVEPRVIEHNQEITFDILYNALLHTLGDRGMPEEEIKKMTDYLLNFFGFEGD